MPPTLLALPASPTHSINRLRSDAAWAAGHEPWLGAPRSTLGRNLDADMSLDDASVHVISESLIEAHRVPVNRLVERVRGILVPLGKGDER